MECLHTWVGGDIIVSGIGLLIEMHFHGVVILPTGKIEANRAGILLSRVHIYHDPATADIPRLDRELISNIEILTWTSP